MVHPAIRRVLRGYDKHGDALRQEALVSEIELNVLRRAFHTAADDPMYDAYPVGEAELRALEPYLAGASVDLDAYEFFLECDVL